MKIKKKRSLMGTLLLVIVFLAAVAAGACGFLQLRRFYQDVEAHTGLQVALDASGMETLSGTLHEGEEASFSYTVSNRSYQPVSIRESVILSLYDYFLTPMSIGGSVITPSHFEIYDPLHPELQTPKIVQGNCAVYTYEYDLQETEWAYENPLLAQERTAALADQGTVHAAQRTLMREASSGLSIHILRVSVLIEGRPYGQNDGEWETLAVHSAALATLPEELPDALSELPVTYPDTTASDSLDWEIRDGKAYLLGMGDRKTTALTIPAQVSLSDHPEKPGRAAEDAIGGQLYPVVVAGDAFYDNDHLETVIFQDGVEIEENQMHRGQRGMFAGCDALQTVLNIPDRVISLLGTFAECSALTEMPELPTNAVVLNNSFYGCGSLRTLSAIPAGVIDMSSCFYGCTSLTTPPELPAGIIYLARCFQGCSKLKEAPALPEGVTDITACFAGCKQLTTPPVIPTSVTQMSECFAECRSLKTPPVIPDGVTDLTKCFYFCKALETAPVLPESVTNLSQCFTYCSSLTQAPALPGGITEMTACFLGCSSLTGSITFPDSVENHLVYTIFSDCEQLTAICMPVCPIALNKLHSPLFDPLPLYANQTHQATGLCSSCNTITTETVVDGLTVAAEQVPAVYYEALLNYVRDEVPDALKASCSRLTFTPDLVKYSNNSDYVDYGGFAYSIAGTAYVRVGDDITPERTKYVIMHELAHCYDYNYTAYTRYSSSAKWKALHKAEGTAIAKAKYDRELYFSMSESSQRVETFAMATGLYFTQEKHMAEMYPGMYAYMENLFAA